jgi:hypothetical protein
MPASAGRADYSAMIKISTIPADEPIFPLRAQDENGADTVRDWVTRSARAGVSTATLEQAMRQADAMDAWPTKKLPDDGHLTGHERKQLAFAYQRRAWNARMDSLDVRVALAQERGWSEAQGVIRALLTALQAAAVCVDHDIARHAPTGDAPNAGEHAALVHLRDTIVEPAIGAGEAVRS